MRYQPMPGGPIFIRAILLVLTVGVAAAVVLSVRDGRPPLAFTLLLLVALAWNVYWWVFRVAAELIIEDDHTLVCLPAGRRRHVDLSALQEVRPSQFGPNLVIIEVSGQRPVLTIATKGFGAFLDELQRRRPDLSIQLGTFGRLVERMPGRSRFRRR